MKSIIFLILEAIHVLCEKRRMCKGCPFYDIDYGCLIDARPDMWNADLIKEHLES